MSNRKRPGEMSLIDNLTALASCEHDDLSVAEEAIDRIVELELSEDCLKARINELENAIAAHAKVCAGVWVPVEERLPAFDGGKVVIHTEGVDFAGEQYFHVDADALHDEGASEVARAATHWLDVRMPGDKE